MQALGFQWVEGSSHPSVENVAIVLPLIAKRYILSLPIN